MGHPELTFNTPWANTIRALQYALAMRFYIYKRKMLTVGTTQKTNLLS